MKHGLRCPSGGFTLMSVIVAALVTATLLSVSLGPIQRSIQATRIASRTNGLLADLRFAHYEAIRRGTVVSLCASRDRVACAHGADWHGGWIVFVDDDGDGDLGSGEAVLRVQPPGPSGYGFVADSAASAISYGRNGFAHRLPAGVVTWALHAPRDDPAMTRCVAVALSGHATAQRPSKGQCR